MTDTDPEPTNPNGDTPAKLPWRKNILVLFAIAFGAGGALLLTDMVAAAIINNYATHFPTILEYFKIIGIGAVALAKDLK